MYLKNLYLLLSIVFLAFAQATTYENGDNNTTSNWTVYDKETIHDKNISTQLIENIFDTHKDSQVIKLKGKGLSYTYLIGDINGSKAWNNKDESIFTWEMKMKDPYQLILFTKTKDGLRYIYFSHDENSNELNSSQYIHVGLDSSITNKSWHKFSFDIAPIIKNSQPTNKLISINGFSLQGLGSIDNIKLASNHNDFISNIKVNKDKNLTISTNEIFKYAFNINWGDGTTNAHVQESITHHYNKEGTYTISINGKFPHIYELCSNKQSLLSIEQWGTQKWKSMKESFKNCKDFTSINTVKSPDLSEVKSMYRMFYNAYNFNADISSWDVSHITDMSAMFYHAEQFNQNIGDWNISSVEDTSFMFNYALVFNQDISRWDVSSVKDMQLMFRSAKMFNQNISNWNVSAVKKMYNIFKDATNFHQNLDKWDTSSLRDNSYLDINRSTNFNKRP